MEIQMGDYKVVDPTFLGSDWIIKCNDEDEKVIGLRCRSTMKIDNIHKKMRRIFKILGWKATLDIVVFYSQEPDLWKGKARGWTRVAWSQFTLVEPANWVKPEGYPIIVKK